MIWHLQKILIDQNMKKTTLFRLFICSKTQKRGTFLLFKFGKKLCLLYTTFTMRRDVKYQYLSLINGYKRSDESSKGVGVEGLKRPENAERNFESWGVPCPIHKFDNICFVEDLSIRHLIGWLVVLCIKNGFKKYHSMFNLCVKV